MKVLLKIAISILLAVAVQNGLDCILPADMSRVWVITMGGLGGMLWSWINDSLMRNW